MTVVTDWREFKLGQLFDLSNGINADKSAYGSGVPFINILEVITNESLTVADVPGRVHLPKQVLARYQVKYGDVLLNRTSETQDEVALTSVYLDHEPVVFGGFVFRARPTTSHLDINYAKYALRDAHVRRQITARGQGGIRANVGQRDLKSVVLRLPDKPEQQAIAATIDDASALIATLERLITKKQAINQGLMQQLLTGRTRLGGFSADWREVRLGDYASMSSGGTPPSGVKRYYGGGIPWVSISDMTKSGRFVRATEKTLSPEGLDHSAARLYAPGVVLYAMYASLGECAVAVGRVSSSQAILGIAPGRELDRDYLYYYLLSIKSRVREIGQQGTQSNLNAGMVRDFRIPFPELDEQKAIANVLVDADQEISALRDRLRKAQNIKTGMLQELLTGRSRLPVEVAS